MSVCMFPHYRGDCIVYSTKDNLICASNKGKKPQWEKTIQTNLLNLKRSWQVIKEKTLQYCKII